MPTHIEWTDETWNLYSGCTVVSPGCTNCYAMRLAATRLRNSPSRKGLTRMHKGKPQWTGEILFNKAVALAPFRWREPRMIFVNAHGDTFHESVQDGWIDFVFFMALLNPHHTFQILTKRPARMREYMRIVLDETEQQTAGRFAIAALHAGLENHKRVREMDIHWPPRNVWLGVSVEDQQRADERIPLLLNTPAAVRWLSCEPLLGPVDLAKLYRIPTPPNHYDDESWAILPLKGRYGIHMQISSNRADDFLDGGGNPSPKIDWVVVGGESGPESRPMHLFWATALRDQCSAAGTAFFFKQWGNWKPLSDPGGGFWPTDTEHCIRLRHDGTKGDDGYPFQRLNKRAAGRLLEGELHSAYPEAA